MLHLSYFLHISQHFTHTSSIGQIICSNERGAGHILNSLSVKTFYGTKERLGYSSSVRRTIISSSLSRSRCVSKMIILVAVQFTTPGIPALFKWTFGSLQNLWRQSSQCHSPQRDRLRRAWDSTSISLNTSCVFCNRWCGSV